MLSTLRPQRAEMGFFWRGLRINEWKKIISQPIIREEIRGPEIRCVCQYIKEQRQNKRQWIMDQVQTHTSGERCRKGNASKKFRERLKV